MADFLPPVIQEFIAEVAGYVGPLRDAIGVAIEFRDANAEAADSVGHLGAAALALAPDLGLADKAIADVVAHLGDIRTACGTASTAAGGLGRSFTGLGVKAGTLSTALIALDDELDKKRDAFAALARRRRVGAVDVEIERRRRVHGHQLIQYHHRRGRWRRR